MPVMVIFPLGCGTTWTHNRGGAKMT